MQFLVRTNGEVENIYHAQKTYIINASSAKEAQQVAENSFSDEFNIIDQTIYSKCQKRTVYSVFGLIILFVPIFLSFIEWKNGHDSVSIQPNYLSCLYAIVMYSSFIIRFKGIQRTVSSLIDLFYCIAIPLLLSSFIRTIFVVEKLPLIGNVDTSIVLLIAVILSCLGMKIVSLGCIIFVCIMALLNIHLLNDAMGKIWGSTYMITAFIGILLYLYVEPAASDCIVYTKNFFNKSKNHIKGDLIGAHENIITLKNSVKVHQNLHSVPSNNPNTEIIPSEEKNKP